MIVECDNCGAPLDVAPQTAFVKCRYCSHSNKVAGTRTLMAMTPSDWQAPLEWDVQQKRAAKVAVVGAAAGLGVSVLVPLALGIVGVAIAGAVVAGVTLVGGSSSGSSGLPAIPGVSVGTAWDGTAPFVCGGNDTVRIEGVTANLPNDVAITVRANCQLELSGSRITARVGVEAAGNREVRISGSTIEASETGIRIGQNKRLQLSDTSVLAGQAGVEASGNAQITLRGGQIEGSPAVNTSGNARFEQRGGQIVDK